MSLTVMIVNYNGARFITECIESVLASEFKPQLEVIVVDNASTDNSKDVLNAFGDKIQVIYSPDNHGFSEGNNIAARQASGDYLFLLNNDTVLSKDTLQKLYEFMLEHPDAGAVSPKLLNADGTLQSPGSIFGRWRFSGSKTRKVPFIAGAAVMMSRRVYDDIGGLDGNLFFYNDDVDMCMTLRKRKLPIYYVPSISLTHYGGLSTQFRKLGSLIEGYRGGMYIAYKHYPRVIFHVYRVLVLFDILPRLLFHSLLALFIKTEREYMKLYLEVIRIDFKQDIFVLKES